MIGIKRETPENNVQEESQREDIDRSETTTDTTGLAQLQDHHDLRILLDFPSPNWDGMGREAMTVYEWASQDVTGPEAISRVKSLIKVLGIQSKGKDLLRKLYEWTSLDLQARDIRKRQSNI